MSCIDEESHGLNTLRRTSQGVLALSSKGEGDLDSREDVKDGIESMSKRWGMQVGGTRRAEKPLSFMYQRCSTAQKHMKNLLRSSPPAPTRIRSSIPSKPRVTHPSWPAKLKKGESQQKKSLRIYTSYALTAKAAGVQTATISMSTPAGQSL